MSDSQPLLFSLTDGVATLTFNRPAVFNSVNREVALGLQQHLLECLLRRPRPSRNNRPERP
jgi:enoyl-CoA hydratase/carnithine racemase